MDIRQVRASLSAAATQKAAQRAAQQEAESLQRAKKPKKAAKQVSEPEYAFLDPQSNGIVWQRMAEDEGYEESEAERNVREEYSGPMEVITTREAARRNRQAPPTVEFRGRPAPPPLRSVGTTKTQRVFVYLAVGSALVSILSAIFVTYLRTRGAS